jgi:hypothetical protein
MLWIGEGRGHLGMRQKASRRREIAPRIELCNGGPRPLRLVRLTAPTMRVVDHMPLRKASALASMESGSHDMALSIGASLGGVSTAKGLAVTKSRRGVGHSETVPPRAGFGIDRTDRRSSRGRGWGCSNKSPTKRGTEAKTWEWSKVSHEWSTTTERGKEREGNIMGGQAT